MCDDPKDLADELKQLYNRFNNDNDNALVDDLLCDLRKGSNSHEDNRIITDESVVTQFLSLNSRKAAGPDNVPPYLWTYCAHQLAPVYSHLFNVCTSAHTPVLWTTATVIPVPKHGKPTCHNDYWPVALTPVPFKCLERILLPRLLSYTNEKLDTHQYAYRKNKSTLTLVENIVKHLELPQTYARALFIDYS